MLLLKIKEVARSLFGRKKKKKPTMRKKLCKSLFCERLPYIDVSEMK